MCCFSSKCHFRIKEDDAPHWDNLHIKLKLLYISISLTNLFIYIFIFVLILFVSFLMSSMLLRALANHPTELN